MVRKAVCILVVSVGVAAIAAPVSAHHSRAVFDLDTYIAVEGVVTEITWGNPHMWVFLDVTDESGKIVKWGIEGPAATAAVQSGLSPRLLKVGARVIFKTHPAKDRSKHIGDMEGIVINGKTIYTRGAIVRSSDNER